MGAVAIIAALVWPSSVLAADTFVDQATGNNSNDCLTAQSPCQTVTAGIAIAGANDTIHVAPGTYDEPGFPTITGGQSLRASGPVASTILGTTYVNSTGTVQGFTFEGNHANDPTAAVRVMAAATLRGNVFHANEADTQVSEDLRIEFNSGSPTVTQNAFTDNGAGGSAAVVTNSQSSPEISDNDISGYLEGIEVDRGSPTISGNDISAIYNSGNIGAAVSIGSNGADSVAPTLTGNFIHDPTNVGGLNPVPFGITVGGDGNAAAPTTGAALHRNRILGYSPAVFVVATDGSVTLDSDLLVGAPDGLNAFENNPAPPGSNLGDVTATNATIIGGTRAIVIQEIHLTLDSSIVENLINDSVGNQTSCTITFSRGVNDTAARSGCDASHFATAADPQFVNSAGGNYHLLSTSPMIDAGDPADPGAALDFDGDPRAVASICSGTVRRDIGADEYVPDCTPPDTQIDSGPGAGSLTNQRSASFAFSSEPGATFECSLDGAAFSACSSPQAYSDLPDGSHAFAVRAKDAAANVDPSPSARSWTVDATPPETQIDSGPADGSTSGPDVSFGFSSEAGASFECSLDGATFAGCGSPVAFGGLASGAHNFAVRAIDTLGNTDPTPAARSWQVAPPTPPDTTPPVTTIKRVKVKGRTAKVKFRSDESGSSFTCKLDRNKAKRCRSPKVYKHLKPGKHTIRVDATDAAGNRDRTPAKQTFRISR